MHAYDRQLPPLRRAHAHIETESAANALTYGLFLRGRRRSCCVYRVCVCVCACVCASVPGSKPRKLSLSRPSFFEVLALYLDTRGICFIKRDAVLVRRKRERESFPDISLFLFSSLGYFFPFDTRFLIESRKFDDRKVVLLSRVRSVFRRFE